MIGIAPSIALGIGQSSPVEVLLYLATAPLQHQGRLADWAGVQPDELLAEVWAPRARDPGNRDSGQTWLGKNLGRLQDEIDRAVGGLAVDIVVKQRGELRLNEEVVLSACRRSWRPSSRLEMLMAPGRSEPLKKPWACGFPGCYRV
jgi:hypothetical protein